MIIILFNSINLETGKKFNNNKQALRLRNFDEVCRNHGLSVPEKDTARLRYTQTEKAIADPNIKSTAQYSWKDEIREAIDQSQATNMDELKTHLSQYGIEIERVTPKSITYRHLAEDKKVRGRRLGENYNKGGIEDGFERQIQRRQQERDSEQPTTNRNDELRIVMNQLKEIQASLNQIGIDSPRIQMNWSVAEKLQNQQDLLMKRLEEIEKREFKRNERHEKILTTIETTATNFDQATKTNEKRFIRAMKHYIQRIDSDNLKQDFKTAMQEELKDIKSETENMVKQFQVSQIELQTSNNEYAKTIEARLNKNETAIKQYDQAVNKLTKGLTSMFFIVALVMVACLVLSPLSDVLGVHYFYEWINHVLKTGHSAWRYFIVILYLIPYILLWLLIRGILSAYKRVSSF